MIWRSGEKIEEHIPLLQAASRKGRSTTEQVLTLKVLAIVWKITAVCKFEGSEWISRTIFHYRRQPPGRVEAQLSWRSPWQSERFHRQASTSISCWWIFLGLRHDPQRHAARRFQIDISRRWAPHNLGFDRGCDADCPSRDRLWRQIRYKHKDPPSPPLGLPEAGVIHALPDAVAEGDRWNPMPPRDPEGTLLLPDIPPKVSSPCRTTHTPMIKTWALSTVYNTQTTSTGSVSTWNGKAEDKITTHLEDEKSAHE